VDLSAGGVVQHVHLHGAAVEGAHALRLRAGRGEGRDE
jgi:hypothetical protein